MNKDVKLTYYDSNPSETNTGMKHVLWEVTDNEGKVIHDWGFADWLGKDWGNIYIPEGYTVKVAWWANTLEPSALISNIIKLTIS